MAEPITPLAPPPTTADAYRPLSPLAVMAIIIAGVFALMVVFFGLVSYGTGAPSAIGIWALALPVAALGLTALARRRIRSADGAVGGQALCAWAWWLSIGFGAIFLAQYFGTYLAVQLQARDFTERWLGKLRDGKTIEAFLETQSPVVRRLDKPADTEAIRQRYDTLPPARQGKPPLSAFRDSDIVQFLEEGGEGTSWRFLGVRTWEYSAGGYKVFMTYDLFAPTGAFQFQIPVQSSEGKEIEGRQWAVVFPETKLLAGSLTQLGYTVEGWRGKAHEFVLEWAKALHDGRMEQAYLDTLEPQRREAVERQYDGRRIGDKLLRLATLASSAPLTGPAAGIIQVGQVLDRSAERSLYLEGYDEFLEGKLLHFDHFEALPRQKADIIQKVRARWSQPWLFGIRVKEGSARPAPVGIDPQQLTMTAGIEMSVYPKLSVDSGPPLYRCEAGVVVESDRGPVTSDRQPRWRVVRVDVERGGKPSEQPAPPTQPTPRQPPSGAGPSAPGG